MKDNVNFRNDFIFKYLVLLVKSDNKDMFLKYYNMAKEYLSSIAKTSKDINVLKDLNMIFDYRTKMLERQL
ncbi:MAG TPA: hypothetical protein IAC02_10335 [Candidatus Coprovivens excrementavium]|nr:hypothetical protein [Candidatus Coprovivens excrementavium]